MGALCRRRRRNEMYLMYSCLGAFLVCVYLTNEGGVENLETACRDYERVYEMVNDEKKR